MKDIKVLHLIDSGGLYGAENMLISLAVEQLKLGLSPVIGSIRKKGLDPKPIEIEAMNQGIDVKPFDMKAGPNLLGMQNILRYGAKRGFDLFHSHGYKTNILFGLMPFRKRIFPMVSTLHGWTATEGWTKMRFNETLDAFSLSFIDKIILVNQGMLSNPRVKRLPRKKVRIINNGIQIDRYADKNFKVKGSNIDQLLKFCHKSRIVASIGRLSTEKGFAYLIEAISILQKKYDEDVKLVLIGDGRLRSKLEEQAENCGLEGRFLITGYIKNASMLFKYFDCYVISSLTEGLPITLLEAMASKTPIVATAVGGIPHVVKHKREALLVSPENPVELATSIHQMLHDVELSDSISSTAREKVEKKYSSRIMAEKYTRAYREVLKMA